MNEKCLFNRVVKHVKIKLKVIGVIAIGVFLFGGNVTQCAIGRRQSDRISEISGRYSEQNRRTSGLVEFVSTEIGAVGAGLGDISSALRVDATDIRSIAAGIRAAAETAETMEKRLVYLVWRLHNFDRVCHYNLNTEVE
jgi:hypothetical protein